MEWEEYKKLWKTKQLYNHIDRINKEGLHLSKEDIADLFQTINKDIKITLKEDLINFVEDYEAF